MFLYKKVDGITYALHCYLLDVGSERKDRKRESLKLDLRDEMKGRPVLPSCEIFIDHSIPSANVNLMAIARVDSLSAVSVLVNF